MSHHTANPRPLFLTEDEALALLDLCLLSRAEANAVTERAMSKLADLARRYMMDDIAAEREAAAETTTIFEDEGACAETQTVLAVVETRSAGVTASGQPAPRGSRAGRLPLSVGPLWRTRLFLPAHE